MNVQMKECRDWDMESDGIYIACAMRGRGDGWVYKLELNTQDYVNCITHAPKDSLILEISGDGNVQQQQ